MRSEVEVTNAINEYGSTVKRVCMVYLKNAADTEDIFQQVFIKYATRSPEFESIEHEKAWIIRVTINECKDFLKSFYKRKIFPTRQEVLIRQQNPSLKEDDSEVLEAVLSLSQKYREVTYLFYYEDYTAVEIAEMLNKNPNTIYTRIARARDLLKVKLGGDSANEK